MRHHLLWPLFVMSMLALAIAWPDNASADTDATPALPATPAVIDASERTALVAAIGDKLVAEYVDPALALKMAGAIRKRAARGEYAAITGGQALADQLMRDLRAVSHDQHLWIGYHPEGARDEPITPSVAEMDGWREGVARDNFGFDKVERMDGSVGYVAFRVFAYPYLAADTASAAMGFVANSDALIIDLRNNGGGDPEMVAYIASYLFDVRTRLNDMWFRKGDVREQYWTSPQVPGPRFGGNKPVFVLTSKATFSAAEDFAYALQALKRATIVGERTGGGAHPSREFRITEHFTAAIPYARSISPITGTNWEGTGVAPDIVVPADQALDVAHVEALKQLLARTQDPGRQEDIRALLSERASRKAKP